MKKTIYILSALVLSFACTNLEEDLVSSLTADQFPENADQINLAIQEPFKDLQQMGNHDRWFAAQEATGDLMIVPTRAGDWGDGGEWVDLYQHTWTANTSRGVDDVWAFYTGITKCNEKIEFIQSLEESEASLLALARMKVLRAYFYWQIIDCYGDAPYVTSFANAPEAPEKISREAIFDSLVYDLEEVIPYFDNEANKVMTDKYTAFAILAKLHINAGVYTGTPQWDLAEIYCDSVIAGPFSLDPNRLAPFETENQNSAENIFTIPFDEDNYEGFFRHKATLHYNHTATYDAQTDFWNGHSASAYLVDLFEDEDTRKAGLLEGPQFTSAGQPLIDANTGTQVILTKEIPALVMDGSFSQEEIKMSGVRFVKFEVKKGIKFHANNDFPIFRLPDFLLMKAECQLRKTSGSVTEATSLINQVREAAGASTLSEAQVSLDVLLEERARELYIEGHRRNDLIRFGKFGESRWEKTEDDSDARNIFPIPQSAVDANPNLSN
jgi:hypothetical protein